MDSKCALNCDNGKKLLDYHLNPKFPKQINHVSLLGS